MAELADALELGSGALKFADMAELADALDLGSGALKFADMAELADAIDLGSIVNRRAGSSPVIRIA